GDLIDSRTPHNPEFAAEVSSVLSRMQSPLGQYAVAGNHDNRLIAEFRYMKTLLEDGGFVLLDNQSVIVDGLLIGGLAESYFGQPELDRAFSQEGLVSTDHEPPDPEKPEDLSGLVRLLLMHQPDYAASLPDGSADLAFSGHSHNGQITFFGKPVVTVYGGSRFPYGLYQLSAVRNLIVSRGLGTVGIPARLGARPELVVVTVRCP
ncbi:MAG: metallophosphoesterase, partial [Bacillota bacterium]|nr:metallophosphoesterase [Bacillota bacterium]